jgi:hypothetical protein
MTITNAPLRGTVADTWAWMQQEEPMPHERADEIGIDPAKEQRLLDAWSHRSGTGRELTARRRP